MSWYYAGPEAKPIGPVSPEELHARRRSGLILPETYVIERTEETGAVGAWKHYRDVFPESFALPAVPPPAPTVPTVPPPPSPVSPPPPVAPIPLAQAHPLFPSAGPVAAQLPPPFHPVAAPHAHYPVRRTNPWCAWGFGLGIAGFVFAFACGLGLLIAVPALVMCILGLVQVQRHPEQAGRGLAIAGGVFSVLALMIALGFLAYSIPYIIKNQQWTVTEQSSTNSE
jgi:hypothetical protein